MSRTNIYNIFPATVPLCSVQRILESACFRKKTKYIPGSALWINRLFIDLANRDNGICLTIDGSGINKDGPGRFQTEADNPEFQTCYFNSANDRQVYNEFVSKRINSAENSKNFQFKIIKLKSKTNKNAMFDATDELRGLTKNDTVTNRFVKKDHDHFLEVETFNPFVEKGVAQMILPFPLSKIMKDLKKELDQDFSHDNNAACEKKN